MDVMDRGGLDDAGYPRLERFSHGRGTIKV